jgi:ferritin-like metal-binding protein YciE
VASQGAPASAQATTGSQIVSYINAQRAAAKLPSAVKLSDRWSNACAAHNHYEALHGSLTHDESAGSPGYTNDGAFAAQNGVIYAGRTWTAASDPFESAPIHLAQVLSPRLDSVGAAESEGYGCATTLISRKRGAPRKKLIYTYPADHATGWRTSEIASEGPYTPGQRKGIGAGAVTGPYLLALFDGPSLNVFSAVKVSSASLTGPAGKVAIVVADNLTSGLAGYLPPAAFLIPRTPLLPSTRYVAKVRASVARTGVKFSREWSFTTGNLSAVGSRVFGQVVGRPPETRSRDGGTSMPTTKAPQRDALVVKYLTEAYGKERQLETALQAQIALAKRPQLQKGLREHLKVTKAQATGLKRRISALGGKATVGPDVPGPGLATDAAGAVTTLANKAMAAAKGPAQALRGTSEADNELRNIRDCYWNEAEEIAHYQVIEAVATELGDRETASLARKYRREEEKMQAFLERQIGPLIKAVVREEVPAEQRSNGSSRTRRNGSRRKPAATAAASTAKPKTAGSTTTRSKTTSRPKTTAKRSTTRRKTATKS